MSTALIDALEVAKVAAMELSNLPDGGTCNFDAPALDYRGSDITKRKAEEAIHAAGLSCFDWGSFRGQNLLVICGASRGQGARRSAMAEAFRKSLAQSGFSAMMYYQMD